MKNMQHATGSLKAIHYLRIDHGEDLMTTLVTFLKKAEIRSGLVQCIGAVSAATLVCGPQSLTFPPDLHKEHREGGHELIGTGMIHTTDDGPIVHLHASIGRETEALTGCLRGETIVYLIVEVVIQEYGGFSLPETYDPQCRLHLPVPVMETSQP